MERQEQSTQPGEAEKIVSVVEDFLAGDQSASPLSEESSAVGQPDRWMTTEEYFGFTKYDAEDLQSYAG